MTVTSVPLDYSITSNNSSDTITLTGTGSSWYSGGGAGSTITISTSGSGYSSAIGGSGASITMNSGTVNIGSISSDSWNWKLPEEFKDAFPDYDRIQKMCEQYPGLKIAFEKFKTTYYLVKDHYDTPEDQRPLP